MTNIKIVISVLNMYSASRWSGRFIHLILKIFLLPACKLNILSSTIINLNEFENIINFVKEKSGINCIYVGIMINDRGCLSKKILKFVDNAGNPIAYGKIGYNHEIKELFYSEIETLNLLNSKKIYLDIPQIINHGTLNCNNSYYILQTAVPDSESNLNFTELHLKFLKILITDTKNNFYDSLLNVEELIFKYLTNSNCNHIVNWIVKWLYSVPNFNFYKCIEHGDFAPWNIKQSNDNLYVFDWEYSTINGFPLIDFFHYHYQINCLVNHFDPIKNMSLIYYKVKNVIYLYGLNEDRVEIFLSIYLLKMLARGFMEGKLITDTMHSYNMCSLQWLRNIIKEKRGE